MINNKKTQNIFLSDLFWAYKFLLMFIKKLIDNYFFISQDRFYGPSFLDV